MEPDKRLSWAAARARADKGLEYRFCLRIVLLVVRRLRREGLADNLEATHKVDRIWRECEERGDQELFLKLVKVDASMEFPDYLFIAREEFRGIHDLLAKPKKLLGLYAEQVRPWVPSGAVVFPVQERAVDKHWVLHTLYDDRKVPGTVQLTHYLPEGSFVLEPLSHFIRTHLGG